MNLIVDFANKIYADIADLNIPPAEKYFMCSEKYGDFVKAYPLVTKYMCFYNFYHSKIFSEYIRRADERRPNYEQGFELQAEYIKHVLVHNGFNKMEAKKISNQELNEVLTQINKIKKSETNLKKSMETRKKQNITEIRKELLNFVLEN